MFYSYNFVLFQNSVFLSLSLSLILALKCCNCQNSIIIKITNY